ncbi:uncharacterized protein LOC143613967 [Bidens hawaiensis]|uniref:uncharacterized protein LOC143613967 n=1 Tax=Bidens hawaiensis TaxID=980011 RepID=UPI00404A19BC
MSQPKFSIPILPTLITNFYTPAPVIYPPRSDPKVMDQTISSSSSVSMDVDPCVVALLRSEVVVVEKVDLTASEHAGVALSEHATKVSTTSTSSTVVAPQALNNVVITKIETKTDDFMTSDSAKAFMKHMEGKIDLKTTQKLTGSSTINKETPSPVASDILDQEPEKKNQELHYITQNVIVSTVTEQEASSSVASDTLDQQKEALDDSYVCAIPPLGQYYKKIAMVEVDESLFKDPVPAKHGAQKKLKISEQTRIPMEESNSVVIEKNTVWCEKLEKVPKLPSTVIEPVTTPLTDNLKLTKGEVVNPNVCSFVRNETPKEVEADRP